MKVEGDYWGKGDGEGGITIKVRYVHVRKCHNETHYFVSLIHAKINTV
jgi:hypothetical protein